MPRKTHRKGFLNDSFLYFPRPALNRLLIFPQQISIPQVCTGIFLPPGEVLALGPVPGLACCGFCRRVRIHSITHLSQASTDKTMAPRIMYYSLLCRSGQHHLKHTKFVGNIIRFDSAPGLQSYLGN